MKSEKQKIKEYIYEQNNISETEKKVLEPIIEDFLNKELLNIKEWDLNTYKKYINFGKKKIIKNDNELENLERASNLFVKFIKENKPIYIITDNDLDGSAANAIAKAVKIFVKRKYKKDNLYEVQFAYGTSHGISFKHINDLLEENQQEVLLITADNGINNREEIIEIKKKYPNIKIIITDHHTANEEDSVFEYVDFVINPESIKQNTVSQLTKLEIDGKIFKTSISGAHTFYLLIKKMLEKMKIRNNLLEEEIYLIALFSDIGDMINYHLDIHNDIRLNFKNFEKKMYIFEDSIDNLSHFNKIPSKLNKEKMKEYFRENITLFNAIRRLNSLLMSINSFEENENNIEEWFKSNFDLDISTIKINQYDFKEYIKKTNEQAKNILEYFGENTNIKYNYYSFIKNIVPYVLLSNNSLKTKEDKIYIQEIMNIIRDFNQIKKDLRNHIMDKQLYSTYKEEYIEIYFSNIGSILREILSIQVFIEAKENIPYLNLAYNKETNEIKGSFRSPAFFPLKDLLLNNKTILEEAKKLSLTYKITGHKEAAGILFTSDKEINKETIFNFFKNIYPIIKETMEKTKTPKEYIKISLKDLKEISPEKIQRILNDFLYVGHHPFFKMPEYKLSREEIEDFLGKKLKMSISKNGNKYLSEKKKRISFLYFGEEEKLKNEEIKASMSIKYNKSNQNSDIEFQIK